MIPVKRQRAKESSAEAEEVSFSRVLETRTERKTLTKLARHMVIKEVLVSKQVRYLCLQLSGAF
jgi:hypothetical protein